MSRLNPLTWIGYKFKRAKQLFIKKRLTDRYASFIQNYTYENCTDSIPESSPFPIWVCWWQGESHMPPLVQMCYRTLLNNANGHPVRLITQDNYRDYVTLPDHILEKVDNGMITITHLSDLLRASLIYYHGGMWIDSTILLTGLIPKEIRQTVYSIKHSKNKPHVSDYRWTAFFWYGEKGNILFHFVMLFFYEYWKKETKLINYLLIDYTFAIAYDSQPEIARLIDAIPPNNPRHNDLRYLMKSNAPFDASVFEEICKETYLHKLSRKITLSETTADGKLTYYGYLFRSYPIPSYTSTNNT